MRLDDVERAADRALAALALVGVLALMAAMAVLMVDIAARKTIGFSVLGMIDLQQLAQMACVFFVLPLAFLRRSHISVDFVTDRLPPRALAAVELASALLGITLLGAILWYSWEQAAIQHAQRDRSVTLGIPMAAYWAPLLLGTALSVLALLLTAFKALLAFAAGRRP
ncbi:MAG TPA: TRAP transporter small permease [Burkholderiales bacterium]|nr:TRAP transporter small permease [Burkholderiales bacterium]